MREGDPARVSVIKLHGDQVPIILQVQQPCGGRGTDQGAPALGTSVVDTVSEA